MRGLDERVSRRSLLLAGGCAALAASLPPKRSQAGPRVFEKRLGAASGQVPLVGPRYAETAVWCYDGSTPGPEIRLRQGERLRVLVDNRLPEGTTVHWHGLRVPNAMDGVPDLTQKPIAPGDSFTYEFEVPDAGTYWYHPHNHSAEQVGRGLYGALIVEEHESVPVDRDLVWVLGDWRLAPDASIVADFNNHMDAAMAGRFGNTVTINGRVPDAFDVRAGERIRLRLINAAPARIFGLEFQNHRPLVVALDGQPVEPHVPEGGRVVLGPAMRADVLLDMSGEPGSAAGVFDTFYEGFAYRLVRLAYTGEPRLRRPPLAPVSHLPANTMPEPDLSRAERHVITIEGGMMSGMGSMRIGTGMGMGRMMAGGPMWSLNGVAGTEHAMKPMLTLARGRTCILAIRNETAWWHPMHLHGHSFRVITRNGRPTRYREWRDTVLIPPQESADLAFVADNPGDWMFHCHILAHQNGGLMTVIRVA